MKSLVWAALGLLSGTAMAAEPCLENFSVQGNMLTGKTYKTWASIPAIARDDAFQRAYAFTVANGFTVLSASKEAGAISAAQSVSYGKGKTVPLNIVVQPDGGNVRIELHYATSGGMISPEDAIKKHFCQTVAALVAPAAVPTQPTQPTRVGPVSIPGYASATEAQRAGYGAAIRKSAADAKLRPLIAEASPAIAEFIERLACLGDYSAASILNAYAAPNVDLRNSPRPMDIMRYHDKSTCATVVRVQGWHAPANNALQFEVVYKADDSGETQKLGHEAVRQPDGTWLFTQ